jgi:hypothetical protein
MPAVLCSLGPVRDVVDATDTISDAMVLALDAWAASPLTDRTLDDTVANGDLDR